MILSQLQRRILAVLEEPESYGFPTLINSVAKPRGAQVELDVMLGALAGLVRHELLEVSRGRDAQTRRWQRLKGPDALHALDEVRASSQWDDASQYWRWVSCGQPLEIILSERGAVVARSILSQDGWPRAPLESYQDAG